MAWIEESGWFPLFAEYLIKSTLALTLALILVLLFRKRSASLRHFILSLSLAGLLLLPVLRYLGSGWETSLLPARLSGAFGTLSASAEEGPNGEISGGPNYKRNIFLLPGSSGPLIAPVYSERPQSQLGSFFITAIPLVWSAGLVFLLLRMAAGIFGAFQLTREGKTVRDPRWRALLERFLAAIHLRRKVRLKSHPEVLIPLTWGFLKPVVMIPDGHESWTEEQRSSTLIHELSHIKRADFLVMVLVRLSLALFWFNPLSWAVFRRLKNEQEEACDELVLRTGIKPSIYAANLLFFKSAAGSRLSHFAALLGLFGLGRSAFNERLAAILRQKWIFQEVKMKTKIMLFCAVILAVALIGLARPSTPAMEQTEEATGSLSAAGASVAEKTSVPESSVVPEAEQGQEQSQAEEKKAQEKKQQEPVQAEEKQEKKEEKKPAVVVTIKEGEKHRHVITIKEGDKVKTITLDKPVIIKEGKEGKVFIITPDGKELKAVEGDPAHLEIMADRLEVIEEGKILKVGKDDGVVYVVVKPDVHLSEAVAAVDVAEAVKVALEEIPVAVQVEEIATPHMTWVAKDEENLIREKLREIREKLKEVEEKKLELREVDEALAELEKELEEMGEEMPAVVHKHSGKLDVFTIEPRKGDQETGVEIKPDIGVDVSESSLKHPIKVIADKKGSFSIYCEAAAGGKGREAYDRIVAKVKKDLPEGFNLEPSFEEESGLITLKVNGPSDKGVPSDLIQKLVDSVREETKGKKE